jgi:hypothetical protein
MPAAITLITDTSASMPLLIAAGRRSLATASSCAATKAADTASQPCTPSVFCAVTAVSTDVPKTPNWWKVLRSAWIPAPPPESDPAIVRAMGGATIPLIAGPVAAVGPATTPRAA